MNRRLVLLLPALLLAVLVLVWSTTRRDTTGLGAPARAASPAAKQVAAPSLANAVLRAPPRTSVVPIAEDRELTVVGDLPPDGRVRVVDARSGQDLARVLVLSGIDAASQDPLPPPHRLASAVDLGPSPIALPANARHVPYWLGGEGYAWRRIEFGASSGEPLYALEPGGGLLLDVDPPSDSGMDYVARIERGDGEPLTELPLEGRPVTLGGLPTGTVRVEFVAEHPRYLEISIATREVEIPAGSTAELVLDLEPLWRPEDFGRIQVSVYLEDERDGGTLELAALALDDPDPRRRTIEVQRLRDAPGRGLAWGTGPRSVGRHRISASPGPASVVVDVRSGTVTPVILEIPALPKVRLWPADALSSKSVGPDLVLWRPVGEDDWHGASPFDFEGGWVFPVAWGEVELAVRARGYATTRFELDVDEAWEEALLDLEPSDPREVLVRLVSNGQVVPVPHSTWSSILASDPSGKSVLAQVRPVGSARLAGEWPDGASAVVLVERPGLCRLTLGEVPGFEHPRPRMIRVDAGRTTVDIELTLLGGR